MGDYTVPAAIAVIVLFGSLALGYRLGQNGHQSAIKRHCVEQVIDAEGGAKMLDMCVRMCTPPSD